METLATIEDVEKAFGGELTAEQETRVEFILAKLSAAFRRSAHQTFTVEQYTHRVKVNGRQARPPRSPLVGVSNVVDDAGEPVPFSVGHGFIFVDLPSDRFVTVTYTAGFSEVPAEVALQLADSAARLLRVDSRAAAGQTQANVTAGPYSESGTFATWAVGGQAILSPDDVALAQKFRPRRPGNVWVGGA